MKDRPWGDVISNTGPVMWTQVINQWKARHDPGKLSTLILPCEYFCAGSGLCVPVLLLRLCHIVRISLIFIPKLFT